MKYDAWVPSRHAIDDGWNEVGGQKRIASDADLAGSWVGQVVDIFDTLA
jgi:hypothetical protein